MNNNGVSIIIPNYNGESLLNKNLPSVMHAAETYHGECEIIVVDDGSRDGSVDLASNRFPQIKVIKHAVNQGFAEAVYTGIQHAASEIIILLNSDVRPNSDFIAPLVEKLQGQKTFSVSPLVCDPMGKPQTVSWNLGRIKRGDIKFRSWTLDEARHRRENGHELKNLFASGGSLAMKKTMFIRLGGFLPIYKPFYYEDVDLCTRAWMNGWQTLFEPRSIIVHDHEGSIRLHFDAWRIRTTRLRNRFFYLWLHLSRKKLIISHIPWIGYRLLNRMLHLDMTYAIALIMACFRLKEVIMLRSHWKSTRTFRPLEQIIEEIEPC